MPLCACVLVCLSMQHRQSNHRYVIDWLFSCLRIPCDIVPLMLYSTQMQASLLQLGLFLLTRARKTHDDGMMRSRTQDDHLLSSSKTPQLSCPNELS